MKKRSFRKQWSRTQDSSLLQCPDRNPAGKRHRKKAVPYRSGTVPYVIEDDGNISVLLVTPRKGGKWILPKGNIARGMNRFHSAVKETCEEAGVLGDAREVLLGIQESNNHQFIEFYPLEIRQILPEWQESGIRSRLFFPLEEARKELENTEGSAILDALQYYIRERAGKDVT